MVSTLATRYCCIFQTLEFFATLKSLPPWSLPSQIHQHSALLTVPMNWFWWRCNLEQYSYFIYWHLGPTLSVHIGIHSPVSGTNQQGLLITPHGLCCIFQALKWPPFHGYLEASQMQQHCNVNICPLEGSILEHYSYFISWHDTCLYWWLQVFSLQCYLQPLSPTHWKMASASRDQIFMLVVLGT